MDSRDVTLSSSNTNLDPEEDSLNDIDNSDADTDILAMGCDQLLSTVEGDLHAASQMSDTDDLDHKIGGTTQQSEAGAQTGHSRILTDREELAPPVDGGAVRLQDKVPARPLPVCLEVAAPGHNALWGGGSVGGEEDCWQKQGYCQQEQYDQQSTTAAPNHPDMHLRKPGLSLPPLHPRRPATSQHHSQGHHYLSSSLPPPQPSPPSSLPVSPLTNQQECKISGGWNEEGIGGLHREGGVIFAPPPSLPQATMSQQAAEATWAAASCAAVSPPFAVEGMQQPKGVHPSPSMAERHQQKAQMGSGVHPVC